MNFAKPAPLDLVRQAHGHDWLRHLGLLSDYLRIPYANGSTFATRALYRELIRRGHRVTVVGPADPSARAEDLLTVCRHGREKSLDRLLRTFAQQVRPACASATLTLVGEGPEHDNLRALAEQLGIAQHCVFVGEAPLSDVVRYLRHADVFVYSSLSETYGQVVSEAQWCGLPVVAFADGMGVSQQVQHGHSGLLVEPGPDAAGADVTFGAHVARLLGSPEERRGLGQRARAVARRRSDPERSLARYYDVFDQAREHCQQTSEDRIRSPERAVGAIGRWLAIQSVTAGLGLLRPPVKLNRHNRPQPHWDANLEPYSTDSARLSSSSLWRNASYSRSILARA